MSLYIIIGSRNEYVFLHIVFCQRHQVEIHQSGVHIVLRHYDNFRWQRYGFLFETQNNLYVFLYVNEDFLRVSRCRGGGRCNSTLYII